MDKRILLTLALGAMSQVFTHAWEPKGDKIKTVWAEQVTPERIRTRPGRMFPLKGKSWSRLRLNHLCPECRKHFFLRINYGINVSSP